MSNNQRYIYRQFPIRTIDHLWPKRRFHWLVRKFKQTPYTLFHTHEIAPCLFHMTLTDPNGKLPLWNCFYDTSTHIFFFEQDDAWVHAMEETTWWHQSTYLDGAFGTQRLFTPKDIHHLLL